MQDHGGRKGVKGLSLVSHEGVPCSFGIRTGDLDDIADGAVNSGGMPSQARIAGRNQERKDRC